MPSRLKLPATDLPAPRRLPILAREIYEPQEDSALLLRAIMEGGYSGARACDMGTGSGVLANELAKRFGKVVAVDVNAAARKSAFAANVSFVLSDLFSGVRDRFDLIAFNSPYLPGDEDARWSCGDGSKLVDFLRQAKGRLARGGKILFLISSLTPERVGQAARKLYSARIIAEQRLPGFETIFVLELSLARKR